MKKNELIAGEFYLIDEKKCLYKSIRDNGIYYRGEGEKMFSGRMLDLRMIYLHMRVLYIFRRRK